MTLLNENENYLSEQLITYIGNKRKLLNFIETAVLKVKEDLGKDKLSLLDGLAGSGVVSRAFKKHASILYSNDLEYYSYIIGQCYLTNESDVPLKELGTHIEHLEKIKLQNRKGIMRKLYSPQNDQDIKKGERTFFTNRNAKIIDNAMHYIHSSDVSDKVRPFLLAPLLSEVSIHANTSGVFKGFYKNSKTGIGQFGGDGQNALQRILGDIEIKSPVFSNFSCHCEMYNQDINILVKSLPEVDLAYYDPPYNQHPYGSNYFMLNIVAKNEEPQEVSEVSGIPTNWNKSAYNKRKEAEIFLDDLIKNTNAKYVALSYNDEGIIPIDKIKDILSNYGTTSLLEKDYNTFRGSRNLNDRDLKVKEILFLLKK